MQEKRNFTITTLVVILILVGVLFGFIYIIAPETVAAQLLMLIGATTVVALLIWIIVVWLGNRAIDSVSANKEPTHLVAVQGTAADLSEPEGIAILEPVAPPPAPEPQEPDESAAIQILAILQRKGRLIDFLQEDLSAFEDAQIGAAVRTIHEGCRDALNETLTIEPVFSEAENSQVTVPADFDAHAIRLVGNVSSEPPFKGTLRHRGWRVSAINLPERVGDGGEALVIAAAEVEV